MRQVSALIFSMNRIDNVIKLANKIKDYVDEIVIIDPSNRRNYEILKRRLRFAKVVWLPPIGMVECTGSRKRKEEGHNSERKNGRMKE